MWADTNSVLRAGKNLIKSRMIMIDLIMIVSRSFTDHFISIRQNSASNIKNKIFNIQAEDQSESDPDIFILLADVKHHNLQSIPVPLPLKPPSIDDCIFHCTFSSLEKQPVNELFE